MFRKLHSYKLNNKRETVIGLLLIVCMTCQAQAFSTDSISPTLSYLTLKTASTTNRWKISYPVYQFQTGDINGDGKTEAMVGVIKCTRHDSIVRRRLFIFKNYKGLVRPLWLGSRLGGILRDFRFVTIDGEPRIRSMEQDGENRYFIAEYRWNTFGMTLVRLLARNQEEKEALNILKNK